MGDVGVTGTLLKLGIILGVNQQFGEPGVDPLPSASISFLLALHQIDWVLVVVRPASGILISWDQWGHPLNHQFIPSVGKLLGAHEDRTTKFQGIS